MLGNTWDGTLIGPEKGSELISIIKPERKSSITYTFYSTALIIPWGRVYSFIGEQKIINDESNETHIINISINNIWPELGATD